VKYNELLTLAAATLLVGATAVAGSAQDRPDRPDRVRPALPFGSTVVSGNLWEGSAHRGRLGVTVTVDQPTRYDETGARVVGVLRNGPAWEAGLREGDIVVSIDGQRLVNRLDDASEERFDPDESYPAQRLLAMAAELEPEQKVEVEYVRDGERYTTEVVTEEATGSFYFSGDTPNVSFFMDRDGEGRVLFEEQVRDVTDRAREIAELARRQSQESRERSFGILSRLGEDRTAFRLDRTWECPSGGHSFVSDEGGCMLRTEIRQIGESLGAYFEVDGGGLLVMEAAEENFLGLRAGDVIVEIDGREVSDFRRLTRLVNAYDPGETLKLTVIRDGSRTTLEAEMN